MKQIVVLNTVVGIMNGKMVGLASLIILPNHVEMN
jgi:hypothetical protein